MADKIALDSKMNLARFDDNFNTLGEGLREAMQKMDDYMNEERALKQALAKLSADLKGKTDGHAFQALKDYLGIPLEIHLDRITKLNMCFKVTKISVRV